MIVKERDATTARIAYLRQLESAEKDSNDRLCIRHAIARLVSDSTTSNACAFIDNLFADCPDWAVLHDLRLPINQQIFQTNHLLINNAMEFIVVDTRYLNFGLTVSSGGVWQAHTLNSERIITSPMNKLGKDIRNLKVILKNENVLPRHCGLTRPAAVRGFVLTNPALRSSVPRDKTAGTTVILSADSVFRHVWKEPDHWLNKRLKPASNDTLNQAARKLKDLHKPAIPIHLIQMCDNEQQLTEVIDEDTAHCAHCGKGVAETDREQCFRNMEFYEGKTLCSHCQSKFRTHQPEYANH